MAVQSDIFSVLHNLFLKRFSQPQRFALSADETTHLSIRPTGQRIRTVSGCAWITCNGKDILLEPGQQTRLPHRGDVVLISTLGSTVSTVEISRR